MEQKTRRQKKQQRSFRQIQLIIRAVLPSADKCNSTHSQGVIFRLQPHTGTARVRPFNSISCHCHNAGEFQEENKHTEALCFIYSYIYSIYISLCFIYSLHSSSKDLCHINFLKDEFSRLNSSSWLFVVLICSLNPHKI